MKTRERMIWIILVIILASSLTFVGLSGKQINDKVGDLERELHYWGSDIESHVGHLLIDVGELKDKVDWIEGRQMELRQQVSDLDHILSDFDKIEERIEGEE